MADQTDLTMTNHALFKVFVEFESEIHLARPRRLGSPVFQKIMIVLKVQILTE